MLALDFVKMHGTRNSFVILNDLGGFFVVNPKGSSSLKNQITTRFSYSLPDLVREFCSQSEGIGADGLVLLSSSDEADFKMSYFNQDGSESEMCGNAVRCLAKYVTDQRLSEKREISFETPLRVVKTEIVDDKPLGASVKVDMGLPVFRGRDFPLLERKIYEKDGRVYFCVSMGNPHAVTVVDDFDFDYRSQALAVQNSDFFPNGVNVEFVKVEESRKLSVRVVERGVGETLSCGTGACASVVAMVEHFNSTSFQESVSSLQVGLLGGVLHISYSRGVGVEMTGLVAKVAEGTYFYQKPNAT